MPPASRVRRVTKDIRHGVGDGDLGQHLMVLTFFLTLWTRKSSIDELQEIFSSYTGLIASWALKIKRTNNNFDLLRKLNSLLLGGALGNHIDQGILLSFNEA